MEMIMINPWRLKVVMNSDDMEKYALSGGKESPRSRKSALRLILSEAKEQTGFDSKGRRILVRMFPAPDGGCEMFVSRLSDMGELETRDMEIPECFYAKDGMCVYLFSSFSNLISACRSLSASGYCDESAAYKDESKTAWYLVLSSASPLVCEMGGILMRPGTISYINEYCSLICESAVTVLAAFA